MKGLQKRFSSLYFVNFYHENYFCKSKKCIEKIIVGGGYSKHSIFKTKLRTTKTTEEAMKTSGMGPRADGTNQRNQEHTVLRISISEVLRR